MPKTDLSSTEKYISRYPWYNLGYMDVYEEICKMDPQSAEIYLSKAAARVYSREKLYRIYLKYTAQDKQTDELTEASNDNNIPDIPLEEQEEIVLDEMSFVPDTMPKFVLAGGDYFSRKELDQLQLDRAQPVDSFIVEKPTLLRGAVKGKSISEMPGEEIDTTDFFSDSSFYTETLANIYTEQGFHKRAIDVYAKLILLYPEKSSYFASLVHELKEKYNI